MLLHQRNQTDVAARTQQPSAGYLGKLVAMYVMMVMASRAAPNQSHCVLAGSSSFISPSVQSNTRSKDSGSRAIRSLPLSKRIKESLCRCALFPTWCRPGSGWNCAWRILREHEGIVSGCEVNRLIATPYVERLP